MLPGIDTGGGGFSGSSAANSGPVNASKVINFGPSNVPGGLSFDSPAFYIVAGVAVLALVAIIKGVR